MADTDSHANWQQVTKLALSIVAVVGIVIVPRLPLGVVRPNVASPVENRFVSAQSVDARLWQDPFEAVDAERERRRAADRSDPNAAALEAQRTSVAAVYEEIRNASAPPLVLLTFIPGGPYPENAESRRRTRYATLSGLRAAGLTPVDAEHVGYFEIRADARRKGLPPLVVYEWLKITRSRKSTQFESVLLLWLDERVFGNATVRKTAALLTEMGVCEATGRRSLPTRLVMLGPAESGSVRTLVEDVRGVSVRDVECVSPTLVLSTATVPDTHIIPGWGRNGRVVEGSVRERMGTASLEQWLGGAGLRFARVLPTDDTLVQELNEELTARKVALRPTDPENPKHGEPETRVAIVSEWDTLYGRRGVELVSEFICNERRGSVPSRDLSRASDSSRCGGRVQLFEYPRGLDGVIPGRDAKKSGDRGDKPAGAALKREADPGERAEGAPQVDYVRRLAAELDRLVERTDESTGPAKISGSAESRVVWRNDHSLVIGVLGSDLYDKLLILQALRPQHPQATFFTFDLDARMLHGDEFTWVRNLLVISPLGLRLRPELQGSIPPFRDSIQTAYFLSARLAVDHARQGTKLDAVGPIFQAAWKPRVFEIGRGQEFDLSVAGDRRTCISALACEDVTPDPPPLGLAPSKLDWWWVASLGLVGVTVLVFSAGARDSVRRSLGDWRGRIAWVASLAGAGALTLFFIRGGASWFEEARPEPFSWDGGVSMWPTEVIRVATVLLALVFAVVAARVARRAASTMGAQYCLDTPAAPPAGPLATPGNGVNGHSATNGHRAASPAAESASGDLWREVYDAITLQGFDRIASQAPADSVRLWAEYRRQSQGWRRNVRIALSMLLAFGVVVCLMRYFGFPHLPARGDVIRFADQLLLFAFCAPVVLWLQMYVVDVIRLCDKVTSALAAERPTTWPSGARDRFWSSPAAAGPEPNGGGSPVGSVPGGLSSRTAVAEVATAPRTATSTAATVTEDASYWLDIRFTADWTARVSWLAYLPPVVICLMMIARSRFFDDWDTPPGLYLGFGFSLAYMVGCVGVLMRRAIVLRGSALRHLQARMRRLVGSGASAAELDRVKLMIQDVDRADEGAFAPLTRQPIFGALAVMFGGAGITAVIQYLMGIR